MLRNLKVLDGYAIEATDGPIGHIQDFYFDDDAWVVRYFVVETGSWLNSRKVLVSPIAIPDSNWLQQKLPVSMTRQQVKDSPSVDTDQPVSRQSESEFAGHYAYPDYWVGTGLWGDGLYPYALLTGPAGNWGHGLNRAEREQEEAAHLDAERRRHRNVEPHLRSCHAVKGYKLHASDGDVGTVAGYLVDDETWAIGYLIVESGHWWAGHQVLIAPQWISGVDWSDESVSVGMSLAQIQAAPVYDPDLHWSRLLDTSLYQHYGRTGYWSGSPDRSVER